MGEMIEVLLMFGVAILIGWAAIRIVLYATGAL